MSQHNSKKRTYDDVTKSKKRKAEDVLFGTEPGAKTADYVDDTRTLEGFTRGDATNEVDAAEVDDEIIDDGYEEMKSEEPEDGESLDANIEEDYRAVPELDRYEDAGLDHGDYGTMAVDERRAAERELDRVEMVRNRNQVRA